MKRSPKQKMMKAAVWPQYGPPEVLQIQEVEKPIPKENEVLIRIRAATVTAGDCEMRAFKIAPFIWLPLRLYMGIFKPRIKILGQEFAGEVEAVGKDVTRFKVGDQVFGPSDMKFGGHAEYRCISSEYAIGIKPHNMSFEEAAAAPTGGLNALFFLRKANIQAGQKILIIGAGGAIGTYGIQLAKISGAEVTAVDSGEKLEMLSEIGADHVIDYQEEDVSRREEKYDVIFDIVGKNAFSRLVKMLNPVGTLLSANPTIYRFFRGLWITKTSKKKILTGAAGYNIPDLSYLTELIDTGKLKSIMDRTYPLDQIVEAHRYVESGQKQGNVAIKI